jgi:hypothetical protein
MPHLRFNADASIFAQHEARVLVCSVAPQSRRRQREKSSPTRGRSSLASASAKRAYPHLVRRVRHRPAGWRRGLDSPNAGESRVPSTSSRKRGVANGSSPGDYRHRRAYCRVEYSRRIGHLAGGHVSQ